MLYKNIPLSEVTSVIFRGEKHTVEYAIDNCEPGEPIEGIHVNQYDKLVAIFEQKRGKKFRYSVDIRYGDWRFILFDVVSSARPRNVYMNPKYMKNEPLLSPTPIPLKVDTFDKSY